MTDTAFPYLANACKYSAGSTCSVKGQPVALQACPLIPFNVHVPVELPGDIF